ncbi:MAG: precorrin-6y C5,15-methyltransferase (decarboxylating) subunit CbiE [Gemmataceae bacterium]
MPDSLKIYIIGVGSDGETGLTGHARRILEEAEMLLGSDQALSLLGNVRGEPVRVGPDLPEVVRTLEENLGKKRMVVVAIGDPLFYGVARYLCDRLGKDNFEVFPHVSSMQDAFARVKESWEEAYLTNLATHPLSSVLDRIRIAEVVGMFPSETEDPSSIAKQLLSRGLDYFRAYVCENLGGPDERVTQGELDEIAEIEFSPMSVMILKRLPNRPDQRREPSSFRVFGNPDDVFAQSRPKSGLITQAEVRALALAEMDIQPGTVVWDIGAGSGSLALEAAQLSKPGMVYAIEQEAADYHLILANAETFDVKNVKAIHGTAPGVFSDLPRPDAIFVGGTGQEVVRLIESAYESLLPGGRLVVNVATIERLSAVYTVLKRLIQPVNSLLVNLSRATEQMETIRFESVNPTFLLWVVKPLEE